MPLFKTTIKTNKEYKISQLSEVDTDPFVQFDQWFKEACTAMPMNIVNSMVLATTSLDHQPSTRVVLLKEYNDQGFIFYTNYESRKGIEINQNPLVSLLFWWESLERQVRIEGVAEKIYSEKSAEYFHSRPKASQIAALASQQSQPMANLEDLHHQFNQLSSAYANAQTPIPCPAHWGGYLINPQRFEFWQGRENRLHDRFQYTRNSEESWDITRLFP